MNKFSFSSVDNLDDAINIIASNKKASFIAGGTNLLDLMKENVLRPDELIDINLLSLNKIEENNLGGLRLGALVSNSNTAYHPLVESRYPLLTESILAGASAQLRNMATNGGNLMQRTRCCYFYDTATPCNKREPGTGCSAINGYNRYHAILGTSEHCIATFPSDMCVALAALGATVNVYGKKGERSIPFIEFHRLPNNTPDLDNNLKHEEIITSIDLPNNGFNEYYKYLKIRDRSSYAFALVSVAVAFEIEGDSIIEARLALGSVAHKPWCNKEAEFFLKGKTATSDHFKKVAEMLLQGAKGFGQNDFKIELAKRSIVRACQEAIERTLK